jgi:predicted N-acetyltransferase YhbS
VIRLATEADWTTIPEVHRPAFGGHGDDVAWLVGELRASEWYEPELSFVAEAERGLVARPGRRAAAGTCRLFAPVRC